MADPTDPEKPNRARKLLVAAVGVATVSYVVACGDTASSGNLMPPDDTGKTDSGNAETPTDTGGGGTDTSGGTDTGGTDSGRADTGLFDVSSGNLVPPDTGIGDGKGD